MSAPTAPCDHLVELTKGVAEMLIETRYAASIHHAHVCAANAHAEFIPFINDYGIKTDEPKNGTKPCK